MDKSHKKQQTPVFDDPALRKTANLCCCYFKDHDGRLQDPCYDTIDHCSYEHTERQKGQWKRSSKSST